MPPSSDYRATRRPNSPTDLTTRTSSRHNKDCSLKTISDLGYTCPAPGKYIGCIKVVDTFGCDTSVTLEVEV